MSCCACAGSCNHVGNHFFCEAHGGPGRSSLAVTYATSTENLAMRVICPDLLRIEQIGEADGWRGRVVRGFFRVLKVVTGV